MLSNTKEKKKKKTLDWAFQKRGNTIKDPNVLGNNSFGRPHQARVAQPIDHYPTSFIGTRGDCPGHIIHSFGTFVDYLVDLIRFYVAGLHAFGKPLKLTLRILGWTLKCGISSPPPQTHWFTSGQRPKKWVLFKLRGPYTTPPTDLCVLVKVGNIHKKII